MIEALAHTLWLQTQVLMLALVGVWLLRRLALRALGARAAYLCWAVVPAAALGAALPGLGLWPQGLAQELGRNLNWPLHWPLVWPSSWTLGWPFGWTLGWPFGQPEALLSAPGVATLVATGQATAGNWPSAFGLAARAALALWLLGVFVLVWALLRSHRRLLRGLAPGADARHGVLPSGCSPALVGVWRPRLYLPEDFQARFNAAEQNAILQHEAAHRARRDTLWNLLATVWAVLHWFNPLAWWALQRMRADQELACDALVLGGCNAPPLAVYAGALMKSHGLRPPTGANGVLHFTATATSWRSIHPLIERVSMLKTHYRDSAQRWPARGLAVGLCLLYAGLGQAVQDGTAAASEMASKATVTALPVALAAATQPNSVMLIMTLEVAGKTVATPRLFGALGSAMRVSWKPRAEPAAAAQPANAASLDAQAWEIDLITTAAQSPGQLQISAKISNGQPLQVVAQPRLVVKEGELAKVEVSGQAGREPVTVTFIARRADKPEMTGAAASGSATPRP